MARRPRPLVIGTTSILCSALVFTLSGCERSSEFAPSTSSAGSSDPPMATAQVAPSTLSNKPSTPNYKIVAEAPDRRFDHKDTYYAATGPVDLSNDGFKRDVKLVLRAVARSNGGPNFSANVYDDETVAKTADTQDNGPASVGPDEVKAQAAQEAQHLVAMYDGGIDGQAQASSADDAYAITWFPAADSSTPNVGQYADSREQWTP
jgi:hypothetical protein